MADGSIIFKTKLDNKETWDSLKDLKREIKKTEEIMGNTGNSGLERELDSANKSALKLQKTLIQVEEQQERIGETITKKNILFTDEKGRDVTYTDNSYTENAGFYTGGSVELGKGYKYSTEEIEKQIESLASAKEKAEELEDSISKVVRETQNAADEADKMEKNTKKSSKAMQEMEKRTKRFGSRMREIVTGALFFNIISRGISSMVNWMGSMIKTNDSARASIAQLKGALLTLAQPILNVVIPAFVTLVNIITRVIAAIASVVSRIFGTTAQQSAAAAKSLNQQAAGYGGVASNAKDAAKETKAAAKEAQKSILAFDELNTLGEEEETDTSTPGADSGGGAGGIGGEIIPDFDLDFEEAEKCLNMILGLVGAIGAGLLAWKLASLFTNPAIAAGIGLIVGGLTLLAASIWDVIQNGFTLENTLGIIGGLLATGLGIAILTGSWIPLLIAAIASFLLAVTVAIGHGGELINGLKDIFCGFADFLTGVFTGDIEKAVAGIGKIFSGLKEVFFAVLSGLEDSILSFLDWLDEKTGGKFHGIIELMKSIFSDGTSVVKQLLGDLLSAFQTIFTGITNFIIGVFTQDWDLAWSGIQDIVRGRINAIISVINGMISGVVSGMNLISQALNSLSFTIPSWVPEYGGYTFGLNLPQISAPQIPYLAQGAVIPPNREFLAVLGDQSHGTNIEAPLETIKQAVAEVLGADTYLMKEQNDLLRQILARTGVYLDGREITNTVNKYQREMARARG